MTRALLHLLCACAVLLVASVHQAPATAGRFAVAAGGPDLGDYVLPDGTRPVPCLSSTDKDGNPVSARHSLGCEARRLTATPELLAPAGALHAAIACRIVARLWVPDTASSRQAAIVHIRQRGPPARVVEA